MSKRALSKSSLSPDLDPENFYHAYLLVGEHAESRGWLSSRLEDLGVSLVGNPDIFVYEDELFGVEQARSVGEKAVEKAFTGRKVFIISSKRITVEAQNALLKTLEEPRINTHFFILVREEALVLPTLASRVRTLRMQQEAEKGMESQAETFVDLSLTKRLAFAKKFVEKEGDLPVFLDSLLETLRRTGDPLSRVKKVYEVRRYASDRAASARLILEHLALVL